MITRDTANIVERRVVALAVGNIIQSKGFAAAAAAVQDRRPVSQSQPNTNSYPHRAASFVLLLKAAISPRGYDYVAALFSCATLQIHHHPACIVHICGLLWLAAIPRSHSVRLLSTKQADRSRAVATGSSHTQPFTNNNNPEEEEEGTTFALPV